MSQTLAEAIAGHRFFEGVPPSVAASLSTMAERRTHAAGAVLFEEGAPDAELVLLLRGRVRLSVQVPVRGHVALETVGTGAVLGWSWAVSPHRWTFRGVCDEGIEAIHISGAALRTACAADHELGFQVHSRLVTVLADRLRHTRVRLLDVYGQP